MACCACLDGLFFSSVEIQSMGKGPQTDSYCKLLYNIC